MTRRGHKKEENVKDVNRFMHEVEEAMHVDALSSFWNTYKMHIFGAVIVAFLAVSSVQWYLGAAEKGLESQSDSFWIAERNPSKSSEIYTGLLNEGSKGYATLAGFKLASEKLSEGNWEEAAKLYDDAAKNAVSKELKELALFNKALVIMNNKTNEAEEIFKGLYEKNSTYAFSAREMLAVIAEVKGEGEKAVKSYEALLLEAELPAGMRARISARLAGLAKAS